MSKVEHPPGRPRVRVRVSDERGRPLPGGLSRWLANVAPARVRGTVCVAVVGDARVRALNRQYRGVDRATDVLSFPAEDAGTASRSGSGARPQSVGERLLGDIVIARGVARRQARQAGHAEATELRVLALHGLLHLLGYDHERDAGTMARVERRLRMQGRLREGLIERS